MANPQILTKPEFPADWLTVDALHGFSKVGRTRTYRPVLTLNSAQYYFGECKTRESAARAHDALLKFFLAFSSSRATPNYPDDFTTLASDSVLFYEGDGCLNAKKLLAIEDELKAQFEALGRSVSTFRVAREKEISDSKTKPSRTERLKRAATDSRKRALIKLEVASLRISTTFDLTGLVHQLNVPKDKWNVGDFSLRHNFVVEKLKDAEAALVEYIKELKTALDLDPTQSTK